MIGLGGRWTNLVKTSEDVGKIENGRPVHSNGMEDIISKQFENVPECPYY